MIIYGVHTRAWGHVGEIELLSVHRSRAEENARARSLDWPYGTVVVTSRELENDHGIWVISEWSRGGTVRVCDGPRGEWRKAQPVL